jgi:hypothetical protein
MNKNTAYLSLSQAAEETGKSKSVISKALKTGKISHNGKDESGYKIDPAELFRVFPKNPANNDKNTSKERLRTQENDIENVFKIKELEIKLEAENKEKSFYKEQYSKIEIDRDDWKKQAQTLLLQSPQKPVESKETIYAKDVGKNENKASAGHVWAIIALFLIATCAASAVGYYYSELKPQAPLASQVSISDTPKKPSEVPVFIPNTPLNFTPSPNN